MPVPGSQIGAFQNQLQMLLAFLQAFFRVFPFSDVLDGQQSAAALTDDQGGTGKSDPLRWPGSLAG
jgi:hypothetical protein